MVLPQKLTVANRRYAGHLLSCNRGHGISPGLCLYECSSEWIDAASKEQWRCLKILTRGL